MFNTIKNWTCLYRFNSLYFYAINFRILTVRGSLDSWLLPTCLIKIKSRPACLDTKKNSVGFQGLTVRGSPNSRLRKNFGSGPDCLDPFISTLLASEDYLFVKRRSDPDGLSGSVIFQFYRLPSTNSPWLPNGWFISTI